MAILTPAQIYQFALQAGFSGQSAQTITAISLAESGGDPFAYNTSDPNGGSFGLTQINGVNSGASSALGNPLAALEQAFSLSSGGTNFSPWTTYNNGSYAQYLPQAATAAASGNAIPNNIDYGGGGESLSYVSPNTIVGGGDYGGGGELGVPAGTYASSGAVECGVLELIQLTPCMSNGQLINGPSPAGTGTVGTTGTAGQPSALSSISSALQSLTNPNTWQRVGLIVIGIIVLLAALLLFGFSQRHEGNVSHA